MASKDKLREKKIADLVALISGDLAPETARANKHLISIDWGEDFGDDDWSVFLIDGKKVTRKTFNKELAWRAENKR